MARKTNCIINGTPYYRIRRKIGNDEHGRPIMKPFYGSSKREAEKLADEYFDKKRNRLKSGTVYFSEISHHYTYNVLVKSSSRVAYYRFMARTLGVKKYDEKGFHTFRRTFCTMLVKNNPIEVVSRIMGHSDISVTAKYYAFVADQRQQQAVNSINDVFL